MVQIDEPALPAVLTGNLPTASGFGTVAAVPTHRAIDVLSRLTDSMAGHPTVAHCCHAAAPLRLLRASGFDALSVDLTVLGQGAAALDPIGEAVETGAILLLGVVPAVEPVNPRAPLKTWAGPMLQVWDRLGFGAGATGDRRRADPHLRAGRRRPGLGAAGDAAVPRTGRRRAGPARGLVTANGNSPLSAGAAGRRNVCEIACR